MKAAGCHHWSRRTLARVQAVSPATVQRIWDAHGLQPHRTRTFKLSRDPRFVEKATNVAGLDLYPPDKRDRLVCRREEPDSGARSHATGTADQQGPMRDDHRIVSLFKRWLLGTHEGAISATHLDFYFDEFTFRFNRRRSRHRGKLFYRWRRKP
jgi:hypothetical protein